MLEKNNVVLRPLCIEDLPAIMMWINDQETNKFLMRALPINHDAEREWLSGLHQIAHGYRFWHLYQK